MISLKEQITQDLEKLNSEQLQQIADYIAFLKFQAGLVDAEKKERHQKGRNIFERVRPELIKDHYNWYININLETEEYFIEQDYIVMFNKLCENPQPTKTVTFRLNETGACGSI